MADRRNLKVSDKAFQQLKDEKPEGVTWSYYLTEIRTVNDGNTDES